jgi:hypothetical protein
LFARERVFLMKMKKGEWPLLTTFVVFRTSAQASGSYEGASPGPEAGLEDVFYVDVITWRALQGEGR